MIKVLNILSDTNIGGAGRCLVNYLKYRDPSQFDVKVVLPRGSQLIPDVVAAGAQVIEADGIADRSFSPEGVRSLARILRQEKPDLIHTHGTLSGRIAGRLCGTKVVYTRHSAFPVPPGLQKGPGHWLNGAVNNFFADRIIAVSPATAENMIQGGISPKKITVLGNGVAPIVRADDAACEALRQKWGVPKDVFTAGMAARLEIYKGHHLLLEAARELKQEGRDFRILIAGTGGDEEALRHKIQQWDLGSHVIMMGFVRDMSALLSIMDIQLNCSYESEACSLSIIEGLSMGLPCVASRCSGNPWLVEDGVSGYLFENRNSHDLADKIRTLMDDPALLEKMRGSALEAYHNRFTAEIFAKNIESLYRNTLNGK